MKIALVANPTAQSGRAQALVDQARALLDRAGIPHDLIATAPDGQTVDLVRAAIDEQGVRLAIAMGGDGTFAEVGRGILASQHAAATTLGMLPVGTANDQGKSFGLEAGAGHLQRNVAVIAAGHTARLDVGRIERLDADRRVTRAEHFFDSASFGFSAAVLRTRNRDREAVAEFPLLAELYRDQAVYTGAALKEFLDSYTVPVKFDLRAELDGQLRVFEGLLDVVIKNTPVFCGEWILAPAARFDDGAFELVPFAGRRDLTSKLLATLRKGLFDEDDLRELGIEHSRPVRASAISLEIVPRGASGPPPAQVDGEEFPAGDRFRVQVLARALRIVVPKAG